MPENDGIKSQIDKLKEMRERRDAALNPRGADGKFVSADKVLEEQKRMEAGEPAGGKVEEPVAAEPPASVVDDDDGDDDPETDAIEAPVVEKTPDAIAASAPAGTEAVEIDGVTVYVDPALAKAYRDDTSHKAEVAKTADRRALIDDVTAAVKSSLPQQPAETSITVIAGPKSPAELAAEKALADAMAEVPVIKPSSTLQLTDPDAYDRQLEAYVSDQADRKTKIRMAEKEVKDAASARELNARMQADRERQATEQLTNQFYTTYPVLASSEMRRISDPLLAKKWSEVAERIRINPPKNLEEGLALRDREFAAVAAEATRVIVAIRGKGAAPVAPPAPPPALATSRQKTADKPPAAVVEKAKEKYPASSVSAMLSKHQAKKRDSGVVA